jgi:hypothetical protein
MKEMEALKLCLEIVCNSCDSVDIWSLWLYLWKLMPIGEAREDPLSHDKDVSIVFILDFVSCVLGREGNSRHVMYDVYLQSQRSLIFRLSEITWLGNVADLLGNISRKV